MVQEISVSDAAELLKVPEKTIHRWIRQGVIPTVRLHGEIRFDRGELEGWARHNRIGSASSLLLAEDEEEDVSLMRAVELGGVHHGLAGGTPAELYAEVARRFPFGPPLAPAFREALRNTLIEREALVSTGIGHGIALPHPRHPRDWGLAHPAVGIFFPERPVDFKAPDGEPVFVLFVILCATIKGHLKMLSQVSHLVSRPALRDTLRGQPERGALLERICQALPDAP